MSEQRNITELRRMLVVLLGGEEVFKALWSKIAKISMEQHFDYYKNQLLLMIIIYNVVAFLLRHQRDPNAPMEASEKQKETGENQSSLF